MEATENEQHYSTRERQTLIYKFLLENSNKNKAVATQRIKDYLDTFDIKTHINTLYADLKEIELTYGVTIEYDQKKKGYKLTDTLFDPFEIRLLAHGIQSSRFMTDKQATELIKKIKTLTDSQTASSISKNVYIVGRIHSKNESIIPNAIKIEKAIEDDRKIRFKYYYPRNNKKEYIEGGKFIFASPFRLTWVKSSLFLLAYVEGSYNRFGAFLLDRMENIVELTAIPRIGNEQYAQTINNGVFERPTDLLFSLQGRNKKEMKRLIIKVKGNGEADGIIDCLSPVASEVADGDDIIVTKHCFITSQLLGLIASFEGRAKIIGPPEAIAGMKRMLEKAMQPYENDGEP